MQSRINSDFYWQTSRDELLTASAINMFQIAAEHDGEEFDKAKVAIDRQYEIVKGRGESQRHGGNFQTFVRVFQEAGWMTIDRKAKTRILTLTPSGKQALVLLKQAPGFLTAVPFFIVELLARYQLNNPTKEGDVRNRKIQDETSDSNIFPYWTIWKIMRSCDNRITTDELRRFVFRLQRSEDINATIERIKEYRKDVSKAMSTEDLDSKYGSPVLGAVSEPKYIMGRAGYHVGNEPRVIEKEDPLTYVLSQQYLKMIDSVLANEPVYKDYLDSETWFRDYGQPILLEEQYVPFSVSQDELETELKYEKLPDDDPIWMQVRDLVKMGVRNIIFVGPPGTSKTTYALSTGAKLVNYESSRFRNIQFHQSFGYDDFVEGYVPSEGKSGKSFELKKALVHESLT